MLLYITQNQPDHQTCAIWCANGIRSWGADVNCEIVLYKDLFCMLESQSVNCVYDVNVWARGWSSKLLRLDLWLLLLPYLGNLLFCNLKRCLLKDLGWRSLKKQFLKIWKPEEQISDISHLVNGITTLWLIELLLFILKELMFFLVCK